MNKDEQPLVSVIVPTHNRADLVGRAVNSILAQTYQNFEVIVVDDCSTDNTGATMAGFNDSRVRYMRNEEGKGGGGTRNIGIEASKAEYVAFLDDDDEWLPEKLEKQMQVFLKGDEQLGVVTCSRAKFRNGKKFHESCPECRGNVYEYLVNTWRSFGTSTVVIKRTFLDKSGMFDASLPAQQELDLFIRLARVCQFDFVNEVLIHIHFYPDSIGGNIHNSVEGKTVMLDRIESNMTRNALSQHRLELGQFHAYAGNSASAKKEFIKAIKASPVNWKPYAHYILLLLGLKVYLKCVLYRHKESEGLVTLRTVKQ